MKSSLEISNKVFKNEEEAEEYLSGHTNKEGAAVAVKVGNFNKLFPSTAVEKKEQAKLISLKETFENWDTNLIANVKNAKSTQRGCKKCGSKVSVKYVKSTSCPVCGDHNFIKTEKDDKAFQALRVKILAQDKMVKEMAKKYEEKNKDNFWYIGAECPS